MKNKIIIVLLAACCLLLAGCQSVNKEGSSSEGSSTEESSTGGSSTEELLQEEQEFTTGGVTDNSDPSAAKTISSKEIEKYKASFYTYDKYDPERQGTFTFLVEKKSDGKNILTADCGYYSHELEISDDELDGLQDIIDKYELVKNNGTDRVTAGIAPEYGPDSLSVTYASGERLYFRYNGDMDEGWIQETKEYLEDLMIKAGFEEMKPPAEAMTIERFSVEFNTDNLAYSYGELGVGEGKTVFCRTIEDMESGDYTEIYAGLTDELYEGLEAVIEANDIESLNAPDTVTFSNDATQEGHLNLYINYVSGRQIYAEYGPENLPEGWKEKIEALQEYLDAYIETYKTETD